MGREIRGFPHDERSLLQGRRWVYDPHSTTWYPPVTP